MNYISIGSAVGCEEILDELPQMISDFISELEENYKTLSSKCENEIASLKKQLENVQDLNQKTTNEKQKLKQAALAIEKQADSNSSYFIYSEKELQDELDYQKKMVSYAKRKIMLYELLVQIEWDRSCCRGRLLPEGKEFDFTDIDVYEQINAIWEII